MSKTESRIQQEIVKWFRNNYCLKFHKPRYIIFSVPNETKDVKELMYKKSFGLMSGVSDLIVIMENKIIFVEVKTEKGLQSKKQKEFQKRVEDLRFEYHIVRSLEQFKKVVL